MKIPADSPLNLPPNENPIEPESSCSNSGSSDLKSIESETKGLSSTSDSTDHHYVPISAKEDAYKFNLVTSQQFGETCKIQAVANIDTYYACQQRYRRIPMFKHMHNFLSEDKRINLSVRELAKRNKSKQGEILERGMLKKVIEELGYSVKLLDFNNIPQLMTHVKNNVCKHIPMIVMYGLNRANAYPELFDGANEHAAIIHGYKDDGNTIIYSCNQREITCSAVELFNSNQSLPTTRSQEFYKENEEITSMEFQYYDKRKPFLKYVSVKEHAIKEVKEEELIKSIIPQEDTGFKGVLFAVSPIAENKEESKKHREIKIQAENLAKQLYSKMNIKYDSLVQ